MSAFRVGVLPADSPLTAPNRSFIKAMPKAAWTNLNAAFTLPLRTALHEANIRIWQNIPTFASAGFIRLLTSR